MSAASWRFRLPNFGDISRELHLDDIRIVNTYSERALLVGNDLDIGSLIVGNYLLSVSCVYRDRKVVVLAPRQQRTATVGGS